MDSAGQKGTGKWTAINALDLGMPVTLIGEAVFARCLSSLKSERGRAAGLLEGPSPSFSGDRKEFIANLEQALYASKIISYAQGFMLIQNAAKEYKWKLNKPEIALMWRGGCIIRSVFLKDITKAYRANPDLENLLFDDFFNKAIHKAQSGWRDVVFQGCALGYPYTCLQHSAQLLRRIPREGPARQPAPGTARLLRRAHLQDQAGICQRNVQGGPRHPRQLDWKGRQRVCFDLHRIRNLCSSLTKEAVCYCSFVSTIA